MFAAIFQAYQMFKMVMSLVGMIRTMMNEYENKKAAEHRIELDKALNKLQEVKSDEEKKKVISDIARNSF